MESSASRGVESSAPRGVESDAETPIKSRVYGGTNRLHPHPLEWVKSVGEVGLPLHEQILVFVAELPRGGSWAWAPLRWCRPVIIISGLRCVRFCHFVRVVVEGW